MVEYIERVENKMRLLMEAYDNGNFDHCGDPRAAVWAEFVQFLHVELVAEAKMLHYEDKILRITRQSAETVIQLDEEEVES